MLATSLAIRVTKRHGKKERILTGVIKMCACRVVYGGVWGNGDLNTENIEKEKALGYLKS